MKTDLTQEIVRRLSRLCTNQGVTHLISGNPTNIRYLTGFIAHGVGDALMLVTQRRIILFSDQRYQGTIEQIAAHNPLITAVTWDRTKAYDEVMRFIKRDAVVGFEGSGIYDSIRGMMKAGAHRGVRLHRVKPIIETPRTVKTRTELAILRKAFALSDLAFEYILGRIEVGRTEIEISQELGARLRKLSGCEVVSFDTIVASGPNSAIPHALPTSRKLRKGDPITLDFGLTLDGYHTDMTRTVFLGEPSTKLRHIYETVLAAQQAAEDQARVGMTGQGLDKIARDIIAEADYGKAFIHSTGHGVGLDIHEQPWVGPSKACENVLGPNMVFTIEPGIYLAGKYGIRIENTGVLTPHGFEPFNKSTKALITL